MKIMIASDIHGSAYYCRKLVEFYKKSGAERLLLLGDILYHGPRNDLPKDYLPKEVAELLNGIKDSILCIKGNCEADVDGLLLDFEIVESAHIVMGDKAVFASHGHRFSPDTPPRMKKGDILLNGHTHIPAYKEYSNFTYINPGSVSIPKENSCHSCIITDGESFKFYDLDNSKEYNIAK